MSLASTPPMLVIYASSSSSGITTFVLKQPYVKPLFLGVITITKVKDALAVAGKATAGGSAISGGHAELQASEDEYAHLRTYGPLAGKFTVELGYDSKLRVSEITCATE